MEDSQIVALYLARDESALERTAEKYGARLRGLAYAVLEDVSSAEECENDAYLKAWNAIPPHHPHGYLFAFLARIVRHIAIDRCRERSRDRRGGMLVELTAELEQCVPAPGGAEERVEAKELAAAVGAFLRALPEEKRLVFLRRYWYFDSVAAIAKRFGFGGSKVKTMLHRTRNELKDYLKREGYDL